MVYIKENNFRERFLSTDGIKILGEKTIDQKSELASQPEGVGRVLFLSSR